MEINKSAEETPASDQMCCGGMTRRTVLQSAAGVGLMMMIPSTPGCADAAVWTSVGPASQFKVGVPFEVTVQSSDKIYVTRTDAKTLVAVSAKCTHRGCELQWNLADGKFECPCHGGQFAANGKNLQGTHRSPTTPLPDLQTVPVQQTNTDVEVNVVGIPPTNLQPGM